MSAGRGGAQLQGAVAGARAAEAGTPAGADVLISTPADGAAHGNRAQQRLAFSANSSPGSGAGRPSPGTRGGARAFAADHDFGNFLPNLTAGTVDVSVSEGLAAGTYVGPGLWSSFVDSQRAALTLYDPPSQDAIMSGLGVPRDALALLRFATCDDTAELADGAAAGKSGKGGTAGKGGARRTAGKRGKSGKSGKNGKSAKSAKSAKDESTGAGDAHALELSFVEKYCQRDVNCFPREQVVDMMMSLTHVERRALANLVRETCPTRLRERFFPTQLPSFGAAPAAKGQHRAPPLGAMTHLVGAVELPKVRFSGHVQARSSSTCGADEGWWHTHGYPAVESLLSSRTRLELHLVCQCTVCAKPAKDCACPGLAGGAVATEWVINFALALCVTAS